MNQLMTHVERIVRPIAATQKRKLRMRNELLAHLQAAFEQERARASDHPQHAIEQARRRLGEPAELTQKLQQTVPAMQRLLFARVPMPRAGCLLERRMACGIPGKRGALTLAHTTFLAVLANLASAPLLISAYSATTRGVPATHLSQALVSLPIGWYALLIVSYRFVFASANADPSVSRPTLVKRGAAILALQIGLTCLTAYTIADRCATAGEVASCAASGIMLLTASTCAARWISVRRRPYDQWLTLNLSETG